jgi:hypothetical protein
LSLNREPRSATSIGSNLGAVAIAPWYARPAAADWPRHGGIGRCEASSYSQNFPIQPMADLDEET